MDLPDGIKVWQ